MSQTFKHLIRRRCKRLFFRKALSTRLCLVIKYLVCWTRDRKRRLQKPHNKFHPFMVMPTEWLRDFFLLHYSVFSAFRLNRDKSFKASLLWLSWVSRVRCKLSQKYLHPRINRKISLRLASRIMRKWINRTWKIHIFSAFTAVRKHKGVQTIQGDRGTESPLEHSFTNIHFRPNMVKNNCSNSSTCSQRHALAVCCESLKRSLFDLFMLPHSNAALAFFCITHCLFKRENSTIHQLMFDRWGGLFNFLTRNAACDLF